MKPDTQDVPGRQTDSDGESIDQPLLVEATGSVAYLTLNRPAQYNALNAAMVKALREAMVRIAAANDVRAVVIRGAGRGFCGGGDIGYVASHFPHGAAAGAGLSLAAAGDLCIAADTARFGQLRAQQAQAWGLVSSIARAATLWQDTAAMAQQLAQLPSEAVAQTKSLLYAAPRTDLDAQLNGELQALLRCTKTPVYRDAVDHFPGMVRQ